MTGAPILVPLDYSPISDRALELASAWCGKLDASLYLVHLIEAALEAWDAAREQLDLRTGQAIDRGAECVSRLVGPGHETTIFEIAQEIGAAAILMGTHGHGGWRRAVLGSRAEQTLRHAVCPVVTITPDASCPESLRSIVVGMDFSPPSLAAVQAARELSGGLGPARLVLTHAASGPPDAAALREGRPDALPVPDPERIDAQLEPIAQELRSAGIEVEVVVRNRSAATLILETARERGADLIALGTHARSGLARAFLGSVAEEIVRHAHCPVLTTRQGPPDDG